MKHKMQLPLPIALLIENCRTSGESDAHIAACIRSKDFSSIIDRTAEPSMAFVERVQLAEELHIDLEEAFRSGYEFGFLHLNGLKKLLRFRFGLQAERDYRSVDDGVRGFVLDEHAANELQALIYRQWQIVQYREADESGRRLFSIHLKQENY
ncbi:hypothetical protein [Paenibacillus sp. Leaf72]|uniref:hypothetical protein n=1 Tax=Paenibacillus sp. Leaf72 TaxID=1736234 RepID=UPI0006F8A206|nr:hypothetical protein [Paenibacillus sp. Leaf72]KQO12411.1 hypothetical protein ASF12_30815 [Paenibacillus sp. Leaf72]